MQSTCFSSFEKGPATEEIRRASNRELSSEVTFKVVPRDNTQPAPASKGKSGIRKINNFVELHKKISTHQLTLSLLSAFLLTCSKKNRM